MPSKTNGQMQKTERPQGGFSLIELLIVVAIILIIAAIAIPNFLRSRMAANEAAAVENVRTIRSCQSPVKPKQILIPGALFQRGCLDVNRLV